MSHTLKYFFDKSKQPASSETNLLGKINQLSCWLLVCPRIIWQSVKYKIKVRENVDN